MAKRHRKDVKSMENKTSKNWTEVYETSGGFFTEEEFEQNNGRPDFELAPESGESDVDSAEEWKPEEKKKMPRIPGLPEAADSSSDSDLSDPDLQRSRKRRKLAAFLKSRHVFTIIQNNVDDGKQDEDQHHEKKDSGPPKTTRRSRPRQRQQSNDAKCHRNKVNCPIERCNGFVVNLPRHYRDCHKDIPEFEIQEMIKKQNKSAKRVYPVLPCAFSDCRWKGTRPDIHLTQKHSCSKETVQALMVKVRHEHVEKTHELGKNMHTADTLSNEFMDWYSSVEGGHFVPNFLEDHKKREKKQQNRRARNMVQSVLETCLGKEAFHSSSLGLLVTIGRKVNGKKSVVEQLKEGRTWGTVKNYLNVLTHFIDFLDGRPDLVDKSVITTLRVNISGSIHTVTSFAQQEFQERKLRDRKRVIPFQNFTKYLKLGVAKHLSATFLEDYDEHRDNSKDAHSIGKHILLQLEIQNGKRTGVFAALTCKEVAEAERVEDGYVIRVEEGKTFKVSGSANIFCSDDEFVLLQQYILDIRPFLNPCTDQVFCRQSGERASVQEIVEFLKDAWAFFGSTSDINVGDTNGSLIRKSIITKSREEGVKEGEQEVMARHMDHLKTTADQHYDVSTGAKMTAEFRNIFNRFHDPIFDCSEDEDDDLAVAPSARMLQRNVKLSVLPTNPHVSGSNQAGVQHKVTFGKADLFSDTDKKRVARCCKDIIDKGKRKEIVVKKECIQNAIYSAGPHFRNLLQTYSLNQICNRVRCEIRNKSNINQ